MNYTSVAEARPMSGLRLVLSMGVPGPWGEAAKGIFSVKGIPFIAVGQRVGEANEELVAWTGTRNAPVAVLDAEKPCDRAIDIVLLAERIKPTPPLLPSDAEDRALTLGIVHEICGERGFGWWRRAMIVGASGPVGERMLKEYHCTPENVAAAPAHAIAILNMLTKRLKAQQARGSSYIVGDHVTAADIYWACFAMLINPLPEAVNPMPALAREKYMSTTPHLDQARDPILLAHRDMMYQRHLKLPLDF